MLPAAQALSAAIFDGLSDLNRRLGQKISWSASNGFRLDTLDEPLLKKMKESGCSSMTLALEHGDPAILEAMNKKLDLKKVEEIAKDCKQLGLNVHMFLMVGYPGETKESFRKSIKFAQRTRKIYNVKRFEVFATKAVLGTKLAEYCQKHGMLALPPTPEAEVAYVLGGNFGRGIITEDFDLKEVRRRRIYASKKLNPFIYNLIYTAAPKWRGAVTNLLPRPIITLFEMMQRKMGW